uniref:Uncharacterized protein n=1 Tax=Setaria viridis TaxID=4556 RepID=A0A4U6VXE5_SETVI|nr:hypothetical protein SEVIR_2G265850v2 [Setaria viridis]
MRHGPKILAIWKPTLRSWATRFLAFSPGQALPTSRVRSPLPRAAPRATRVEGRGIFAASATPSPQPGFAAAASPSKYRRRFTSLSRHHDCFASPSPDP